MRDKSSGSYKTDAADVFTEGLNNSSCRDTLFNCLKELEPKVLKMYEVGNTTKENQIKSDKQLKYLTSSVDHISKKFDACEEDRKEKYQQIKCLQERLSFLENTNDETDQQIDRQAQYSRMNCLRIHSIKQKRHEATDDLVNRTSQSEIDIDINVNDIDRTHRKAAEIGNKRRAMILKFARYSERRNVLTVKRD